jgi:hypothetical protein
MGRKQKGRFKSGRPFFKFAFGLHASSPHWCVIPNNRIVGANFFITADTSRTRREW